MRQGFDNIQRDAFQSAFGRWWSVDDSVSDHDYARPSRFRYTTEIVQQNRILASALSTFDAREAGDLVIGASFGSRGKGHSGLRRQVLIARLIGSGIFLS